ncbi:triose-phosphate isomerase [Oharaeibacter diazotrophicus]|uniref:Triosephosphate isomerase n=1 Tax=Oharaeibacter diazotrophicus TaxID=1920512 RepID=A0A4R6RMM4_9HYPH|nr:triose-phosphate isomerase [Oharaeibacter diazotrophicus]TDP87425.1 triosephosphate isomerase [Oharaeibacter diazotrophicus]BBE70631.1 triosephosphate isomerase [Pleomorphomonas sp. SM30]GLS77377.1 triosephosphate isomerase [Oharaeibacter diazotrophicus]
MAVKPLVAGNWKMNGTKASVAEFVAIADGVSPALADAVEVAVCPPATLVAALATLGRLPVGGQDCHADASGAHTGDVAAEQLKDAGATYVIVGHSERRADHGETDAVVAAKARAARRAGLVAIVCVGETRAEREAGRTLDVVGTQLAGSLPDGVEPTNTVVAYEPVWAIGTGLTPTVADVAEVHAFVRARLVERFGAAGAGVRILYGGSVKPSNARELMAVPEVNGALVGGASLKAADFLGIVAAYA